MKKLLLLLFVMLPFSGFAQKIEEKQLTKFEEFTSKTGHLLKFIDYDLPELSTRWFSSKVECGIRELVVEGEKSYFYRIEKLKTSTSLGAIAMIEYSDLVEINKAIIKLMKDVDSDCALNPDYLENKFITEDGMRIGYYVLKGKAHWYMQLERFRSSDLFFKEVENVAQNFKDAQEKIEELKTRDKQ